MTWVYISRRSLGIFVRIFLQSPGLYDHTRLRDVLALKKEFCLPELWLSLVQQVRELPVPAS